MGGAEVDWGSCRVVEVVPGRVSGAPVLRDTRLPVSAVLDNFDSGLDPEQVADIFEVPVEDVREILAYRESRLARSAGS